MKGAIHKNARLHVSVSIRERPLSLWRIIDSRTYPWCVNLSDRRGTRVFKTLKEAAAEWKPFIRRVR